MHTVHGGLSIVVGLKNDRIKATKDLLKDMNLDPANNCRIPFAKSPSTLFVSGVVIPGQDYHGEALPATLLLLTSFSGPLKKHLKELMDIGAPGLRELFQHAMDYPPGGLPSGERLKAFLKNHLHASAFYTGMQGITCGDVGKEEELRQEINQFIDCKSYTASTNPVQILNQIQQHIRSLAHYNWAQNKVRKNIGDSWQQYRKFILLIIKTVGLISILALLFHINKWIAISAFLCGLLFIIIFLIAYRIAEMSEEQVARQPKDSQVRKIALTQKHVVLNELTAAGIIKKGWVRRMLFLAIIRVASAILVLRNVPTITTARWMAIDKGKRLVFISNFANQAESYVRDFIDYRKSAKGINFLFGLGAGYPKTKWLIGDGALKDPDGFMNVFQQNQQVTQFWYWPYQNLSVDNINKNRKIRVGLFANFSTTEEIEHWLSLL